MLFCITLAVISAVSSAADLTKVDDCPTRGVMICSRDVKAHDLIFLDYNVKLEESENILEKKCGNTMPVMKCAIDYATTCSNYLENPYYLALQGLYSTLGKICDKDNDIRRWFIENSKCLNKQNSRLDEKCGERPQYREYGNLTKEICLSLKRWLKCYYEDIEEKCGREAVLVTKERLSSMTKLWEIECMLSAAEELNDDLCPAWGSMYCAKDIRSTDDLLVLNDYMLLEENEEALEKKCKNTVPYAKCVVDYGLKFCQKVSENIHYQGFKYDYAIMTRICDKNDEARRWYMENVKCLNKQKVPIYTKCEKTPRTYRLKDVTKEVCEIDKRRVECNYEEISKNCGNEALKLVKLIMLSYTNAVEKACSKFQL